jgi:MFS family permease
MPLKTVVRDHRGAVVISMLLTWMLSAGIVVVILLTPTYLQTIYGFDARTALVANSAATLCLSIGCVVAGVLADRIGARLTLSVGGAAGASAYVLYTTVGSAPDLLLPLYALAGFFVGTIGAVPYVLVHAFPAQVRFSGLSFSYNVSYAIFGGLTPVIVSLMLKNDSLAPRTTWWRLRMGIVTALFVRKRHA